MQKIYSQIINKINRENVFINEPMYKHTTFKIGGIADIFIKVKSIGELKTIIKIAKENEVKTTIIGNGSNILVLDSGIRGIVIKLEMDKIEVKKNCIYAEAGAALSKVCNIAKDNALGGLEFAYGIPGSIGGAVIMNAGAFRRRNERYCLFYYIFK